MSEITIDGMDFRIGRLPVKQQFHVAKRLLPILGKLSNVSLEVPPELIEQVKAGSEDGRPLEMAKIFEGKFLDVLIESISGLSDKDCDFMMATTLSVVTRRQNDRWQVVWNKAADAPQFADMPLLLLLRLVAEVIRENLADFMPAPSRDGTQLATSEPNAR